MISEKRILEIVLESVKTVRDCDAALKGWVINPEALVLGMKSPMDSVAFTAFVVALEEKIENEINCPYALDFEKLHRSMDFENFHLSVSQIAKYIVASLPPKTKRS
jgi:hypothetical protein